MHNEHTHYEVIMKFTKTILYFKMGIGIIMVLTGIIIAMQVVTICVAILMTPEKVPFFELIRNLEPSGINFFYNTKKFSIPETIFSYSVAGILLIIVSSLSKKILETGTNMISIELKILLNEMVNEWHEIRKNRNSQKN